MSGICTRISSRISPICVQQVSAEFLILAKPLSQLIGFQVTLDCNRRYTDGKDGDEFQRYVVVTSCLILLGSSIPLPFFRQAQCHSLHYCSPQQSSPLHFKLYQLEVDKFELSTLNPFPRPFEFSSLGKCPTYSFFINNLMGDDKSVHI